MSHLRDMELDKSVDLNGVLSCRATLFECLRHNLLSLWQVSSMWRHKPDLLPFRFIAAGLPLTWKTWKSQGIWMRPLKVREKSGNFVVWNSFSAKLKILILKIFWGACPQTPLNGLGLMVDLNLGLEKSGNFILSGKWQPCIWDWRSIKQACPAYIIIIFIARVWRHSNFQTVYRRARRTPSSSVQLKKRMMSHQVKCNKYKKITFPCLLSVLTWITSRFSSHLPESDFALNYPGDFGGNAHRGIRWHSMQSFGGPFHSKITWAGTGLIEGCNKRKCVIVICSLKMEFTLARFPTYVNASRLLEIVKIKNVRILN